MNQRKTILELYNNNVSWYESERGRALIEKKYLDYVLELVPTSGSVLDLGCGIGEPIAAYISSKGFSVTGVDGAENMIQRAKELKPTSEWIVADMRTLQLNTKFKALIAWDSFFHLTHDEQRKMFTLFSNHLDSMGILVFTSGPDFGEAYGDLNGHELYHSSLSSDEYHSLLKENGFKVLKHEVEDPACGGHTVWIACKSL